MHIPVINSNYLDFTITSDKSLMHPQQIHQWLSTQSYWCKNIPYEVFKTSFDNSFTIGCLLGNKQLGYARFVTDYSTFAYLADVYVVDEVRGMGISKAMMSILLEQDWVKKLRRIMLATKDAHGLYSQYGFSALATPEKIMEIVRPNIYE